MLHSCIRSHYSVYSSISVSSMERDSYDLTESGPALSAFAIAAAMTWKLKLPNLKKRVKESADEVRSINNIGVFELAPLNRNRVLLRHLHN